jgi:cysteine synthase
MTGRIAPDIIALIGNTPLVKLKGPSAATGSTILGKAEFLNPGGSVKDRAALGIIEDAEARGLLQPGGIIVEGTAGNTGIGLAVVGSARGYRTIIVMPETQSREKQDTLRALGAELVLVPAAPYSNPAHYVHTSRRIAEETPGAVWANQFDNVANRMAHIRTTAPEIWAQTEGRITGFTCAVGTGGTLAGVALGLRAENPDITIALTDPEGAALYNYFARGELSAEGSSVSEGIGQSRITANLDGLAVDTQFPRARQRRAALGAAVECRGGAVPGSVVGHQRGRGRASRRADGARPNHRHHPVRFGAPLSFHDLQCRMARQKGPCLRRAANRPFTAGAKSLYSACHAAAKAINTRICEARAAQW